MHGGRCKNNLTINKTRFYFAEENNTGLPPVLFHAHSPIHRLKFTDIFLKLNRLGNTFVTQ